MSTDSAVGAARQFLLEMSQPYETNPKFLLGAKDLPASPSGVEGGKASAGGNGGGPSAGTRGGGAGADGGPQGVGETEAEEDMMMM